MKALINKKVCVACGCCVKVCKKDAIQIKSGVYALVDEEKCVGCGICAKECPASIITITEKRQKDQITKEGVFAI